MDKELLKWYRQNSLIKEATDSVGAGGYKQPLSPGMKLWDKKTMKPFDIKVSKWDDAQLAYDSYDGSLDISKSKAKKMEKIAKKIEKKIKNNPVLNDDDGDILNGKMGGKKPMAPFTKKINEAAHTDITAGEYNVPLSHGFRKWKKTDLSPFDIEVEHIHTHHAKKNELDDLIVHHIKSLTEEKLKEDLAVWFGTKKKPKGSKQPKGPWVNICRKKDGGGHPPCGRPDASDKAYPKCRAAGVAAHMTDAQKRAACQQKRKAEKSHNKSGTGNKPKMTHYKPKKESVRDLIKKLIRENLITNSK